MYLIKREYEVKAGQVNYYKLFQKFKFSNDKVDVYFEFRHIEGLKKERERKEERKKRMQASALQENSWSDSKLIFQEHSRNLNS